MCSSCRQLPAARRRSEMLPHARRLQSVERKPARSLSMVDGPRVSDGTIAVEHQGGLRTHPDRTLWIVARGKPITQGSMRPVSAKIVKHEHGPELRAWRDLITRQALRAVGEGWTSVSGPVRLQVALTIPVPKTLIRGVVEPATAGENPRVPPIQVPDVDKLLRAVQDSLSPREPKRAGGSPSSGPRRFQLLTDDSRIVDSSATKTYPSPEHTHSWALPWPGAVIRLVPLDVENDRFPESTLRNPGNLPAPAQALCDRLSACARG
jgi:Holliday junction resolvase RusA-like endonuclease